MSRSIASCYKIIPTCTPFKRFASKRIRRVKDFCQLGGAYKKLYDTYNINDGGRARPIEEVTDEEEQKKLSRK